MGLAPAPATHNEARRGRRREGSASDIRQVDQAGGSSGRPMRNRSKEAIYTGSSIRAACTHLQAPRSTRAQQAAHMASGISSGCTVNRALLQGRAEGAWLSCKITIYLRPTSTSGTLRYLRYTHVHSCTLRYLTATHVHSGTLRYTQSRQRRARCHSRRPCP